MRIAIIVAVLATVCAAATPPPADFDTILEDMLARFRTVEQNRSLDETAREAKLDRIRNEGLSAIDYESLSAAQIERLTRYIFFSRGEPDYSPQVLSSLSPMIESSTEDGAYAASLRADVIGAADRGGERMARAGLDAITHPGVAGLFRDSRGNGVFVNATRALSVKCEDTGTLKALPAIRELLDAMPHDARLGNLAGSFRLYDALATHSDDEARALAASMREDLLQWGRTALDADDIDKSDRRWAEYYLALLEHGPTRVDLVGSQAPDVDIAWWSDASDGVSRLSDLRGEIVVLDHWASNCGFSDIALLDRNAMIEAYQDQPVRFVAAATHATRFVMLGDTREIIPTPTVEAEAEATEMLRGRRGYESTFAIVDDADRSFVAQYGLTSVPTTVIVDHLGVVRAVGHDPRRPEPTESLLEQILEEMPQAEAVD